MVGNTTPMLYIYLDPADHVLGPGLCANKGSAKARRSRRFHRSDLCEQPVVNELESKQRAVYEAPDSPKDPPLIGKCGEGSSSSPTGTTTRHDSDATVQSAPVRLRL